MDSDPHLFPGPGPPVNTITPCPREMGPAGCQLCQGLPWPGSGQRTRGFVPQNVALEMALN